MQYYVTIQTSEGRQVNHIRARNLVSAIRKVGKYNQKHPTWEMYLMEVAPASDSIMMPVELIS